MRLASIVAVSYANEIEFNRRRRRATPPILLLLLIIMIQHRVVAALAIDCFKCVSINHDYQPCDDPFHNNYTADVFESPCMGGRKGRDGLFPATSCIKITAVFGKYTTHNFIILPSVLLLTMYLNTLLTY